MADFQAVHRYARIGPRKARLVVDQIRGADVNQAFEVLRFSPKRAAVFVEKVLRSAVANASQNETVNVNRLYVKETRVDGGPLAQGRLRFRPGPMGRAHPIRKRTSHIRVVLSERGREDAIAAAIEDRPKVVDPEAELHREEPEATEESKD